MVILKIFKAEWDEKIDQKPKNLYSLIKNAMVEALSATPRLILINFHIVFIAVTIIIKGRTQK